MMSARASAHRELWVCWQPPRRRPSAAAPVLSFLSPSLEERLQQTHPGPVILAREASRGVRAEARELYLTLVARLGTVPCDSPGMTLRGALSRPGEASHWWYHQVAFKDCERDPAFAWIIAVLTIRAVAQRHRAEHLVLVGAPSEVVAVLRRAFSVEARRTQRTAGAWQVWLTGLGARVRYALTMLRQQRALRRHQPSAAESLDIVFSGFWDWSVRWDPEARELTDRYFQDLPDEFRRQGMTSLGWLAWFDPHAEPGSEGRRWHEVLAPLNGHPVVILQHFLRPRDILNAIGDFRPLRVFLRLRASATFSHAFQVGEFNYAPLFWAPLLRGFLDASLPHGELVATATARACRRYQPKVALSFLEHFPYSRAHYEGVRQAGQGTTCIAVQHASYSHEKTFLFLHPAMEFQGEPDGHAVPHPDYVCAMGALGRDLFLECGYPWDRVLLTGSPRYDPGRLDSVRLPRPDAGGSAGIRLLMVCALDMTVELEMVDAVCAAASGLTGVSVSLRDHPFSRIAQHPRFARYRDRVILMHGSLGEQLAQADLVLFSYSTVAEEAFVSGKPAWQWLPLGFNGSALVEAAAIPQFGSVTHLRNALREFQADPGRFLPSPEARERARARLFVHEAGNSGVRIAGAVREMLAQTCAVA